MQFPEQTNTVLHNTDERRGAVLRFVTFMNSLQLMLGRYQLVTQGEL